MNFRDLLDSELLFFDGAMGTMLQARGLKPGELPELWNFTHADIIKEVHTAYLEAGVNIIKTNTFGANRLKFAGTDIKTADVVAAGVRNAKEACANFEKAFVALDLGPTGKLLAPYGDLPFEEAVDIYGEIVRAGSAAGADLVLIETMSDTYETKAAILAAKENCDLPVVVTMTFDIDGKLLTGGDVAAAALMVEGLGADAIGFNCGLGPAQMQKLLPQLLRFTSLPIVLNPNAGLPVERDGKTCFDVGPEEFADLMYELISEGVSIAGGCCGTTPTHIGAMIAKCKGLPAGGRRDLNVTAVSSYGKAVVFGEAPLIIGERINPTGKPRLKEALQNADYDYICRLGLEQISAGSHILDVNVGMPGLDEVAALGKAVLALQGITDTPLQIDTSNYEAMERAMRLYNGKPMLNSVNGKAGSLEKVLPLVKKYGAVVVALCLDDSGIPLDVAGRVAIAEEIIAKAGEYGISSRDIAVDPLALTISTGSENAKVACEVISAMSERGINTVMGVSNISFGLPGRELINSVFYTLALQVGLTSAIINPQSQMMMDAYYSFLALSGLDDGCKEYVARYANAPKAGATVVSEMSLFDAIVKGLIGESKKATAVALEKEAPLEVINKYMIPALDFVGDGFEKKTLFLPQLLMSADAAKAAFDVIRDSVGGSGEANGEKVIIATVQGDIHDIGKNIVKVLMENYGYRVIDLGKDVPVETVVAAAKEHGAKVVGLSALMTTTVAAMEETIKALRKEVDCKVVVGGAVLTEEYAQNIGADHYAPNAVSAVNYVNSIFSKSL
ncbi:MAG: homocysteine S-methyltransferase family protein [Phascolarctobacterium sp.]|nr:homocysteine S-methyltransferase family protein [Phascolarctobacterium sp.]MBR2220159.1 homocysteine S-methyltransferase family protein [Phascolarctobacterium sp.]